MSWVICCFSSAASSTSSLVTAALALILSWVSYFSLSALWAATTSCKYEMPGYHTGNGWSHGYAFSPHGKGDPGVAVGPPD